MEVLMYCLVTVRRIAFVLAALAALGLAGPVAAGEDVPFKGHLEGDVTITPLAPPFVSVVIEATGNATHLGKFTLDMPHVVNRANGTAVGSYEFTAANGDTLSADFTGKATPTATPGVLYILRKPRPSRAARAGSPAPPGASPASACSTRLLARPSVPSKGPSPSLMTTTMTTTNVDVN
jgi:hypothetical protein